jgi:2-dehydro-3-deoxygluconokinase
MATADVAGFALAAAAMKHAISGDFNLARADQIEAARAGAYDVRR